MNATDYSQLSTSDLIQQFIHEAKRIGCIFSPDHLKVPFRSVEYDRGKNALHAIGVELRTRSPVAQARAQLFANESPDVRGWAGGQLHSIDGEWAEAALSGLRHNLTTHEVLAWRDRILKRSAKPDFRTTTTSRVLDHFADACERCYGATRFLSDAEGGGPNLKAHNKVSGDIYAAAAELNRRGELRTLVPLLKHPLVTVRERAAAYCLPVATEAAVATLEEVFAAHEFPEFLKASRTLDYWRSGQYCAFPDDPKQIRI
jgi:Domain of unknown function (DUF2019)